jgi:hypothetical protein
VSEHEEHLQKYEANGETDDKSWELGGICVSNESIYRKPWLFKSINYVSFLQKCAHNQFSDWKIWIRKPVRYYQQERHIGNIWRHKPVLTLLYPSGNQYLNYLIIHLELYCFSHLLPWHEPPGVFLGFLWSWHIRGDSVCQTESWTISNKETSDNCEWKRDTL